MKYLQRTFLLVLLVAMLGLLAACSPQPTPTASMPMSDTSSQNSEMQMVSNSGASDTQMDMGSSSDSSSGMQMGTKMDMPADLDTSTTVASELGIFKVSYQSSQDAQAINEIFSWTLHIETADGRPVEDAEISITTLMPQHGHPMPTQPQITQNLGDGNYKLEGLKYSMPGWWEETLTITAGDQTDLVTFNQVLK
jgi:hypothetical protein